MIKFKQLELPLLKDRNYSPQQVLLGVRLQLEATNKFDRDVFEQYTDFDSFLATLHNDLKQALWYSIYGDLNTKLQKIHKHLLKMEESGIFPLEVRKLVETLLAELNETKP